MNLKNLYTTLLLWVSFSATAQLRYAEGLVVTNDGDTLKGLIEQREVDLNPSQVNFKPSQTAPEKTFTVDDILYFSVPGMGSYQRFTLAISMDPVDLDAVQGYSAPPAVRKTVFLKIHQKGRHLALYSFRDELKVRFYATHSQSAEPQELVYKVLRVGGNFAEVFSYRELLTFIGERAGVMKEKLKQEISKAAYNEGQILKVASKINGIKPEKFRVSNKVSTGFRVGAGLNVEMLQYYGNEEFSKNAESSPGSMYWFSVGYDLAKNPYIGKMVFRGDLTYSAAELTTTTYDYRFSSEIDITHRFKQRTIGLGVYGLYNIYNEEKLKFFVSLGVRSNFSAYDNFYELKRTSAGSVDIIPNKDAEPRRTWFSIPVKVGIVFRQKVEVGVMYSPNMVLSHGDFPYKYGITIVQAGCVYHF